MKFIEISEGVFVNIEKIEAVEVIDQLSARVITSIGNSYIANFPALVLLNLIDTDDDIKEIKHEKTMEKLDGVLSTAGFFAG